MQWQSVRTPVISDAQFQILATATPAWALKTREGKGGGTWTYVPHGYVTAELNKAFGWDWDAQLIAIDGNKLFVERNDMVAGKSGQREARYLTVCVRLTARVRDPNDVSIVLSTITKDGIGSQEWQKSMEFGDALKGARSDGIKTAATLLGIALDLYYSEEESQENYNESQAILKQAAALQVKTLDSADLSVADVITLSGMTVPALMQLCKTTDINALVKPENLKTIKEAKG